MVNRRIILDNVWKLACEAAYMVLALLLMLHEGLRPKSLRLKGAGLLWRGTSLQRHARGW